MARKDFPERGNSMANQPRTGFDVFSSAWLHDVPANALDLLRQITEFVDFKDKDTIYALGGPQEWVWGIADGRVKVLVAMTEMDPVLGHIHHPGAWFGESEVIHAIDGLVEMKAVGETRLSKVPYAKFRKIANEHPALWEAFARLTSMNQLLAMSAANDLALRTSRQRLAATLMRLCGRRGVMQGSRASNIVNASQLEIAPLANVSASKASVHLGELAGEGFIRLEYGRIDVLDEAGLLGVIGG